MNRTRIVAVALASLLAFQDYAEACGVSTAKPFDPSLGTVKVYIHPYFGDPSFATIAECFGFGVDSWNDSRTPIQVTTNIEEAHVGVIPKPPEQVSPFAAAGIPDAKFNILTRNQDKYLTLAEVWMPNNISSLLNYEGAGGCTRAKNLMAHELSHGYFGTGLDAHTLDGVTRGGNPNQPYAGLDTLGSPAPCDFDQAIFGRSYNAPNQIGAGGVNSCQPGAFHDNHGCPCTNAFYVPPSMWAAHNHKPYGHIQWPYSGTHAPFSGTLQMHTTDVDGAIWFIDYFVNGTYLTRSYGKDSGFFFNATPGAYYIEQAIYDNTGEYAMGTPKQVNVCGGPPAQVNPVYHWVTGGTVGVYWSNPSPGFVTGFAVEGGTYPGGANLGTWYTGGLGLQVGPVGSGVYYVRVKAYNPCGVGSASPEVVVVVP